MKTKLIYVAILAFIIFFPFRYAYLDDQLPNAFNILCMLAVVIGALSLIFLNTSNGKQDLK